ncbi:MAG: hypothetical protein HWE39_12930 [Oceanospirillaceae bacterium]|nr:hypothetical protein [Oceanospirillaceae bacterium]
MSAVAYRSFHQRNTQNKHIASQLHKAQCAVNKLADTGLTVIDVKITGSRPVIEIQYQKRCEYLNGTSVGRRNLSGDIEEKMTSIFCHCEVIWVQPDYVAQLARMKGNKNG